MPGESGVFEKWRARVEHATLVNSRKKGKVIVANRTTEVERGFITYPNGEVVRAIKFRTGIVHEYKSGRGVRVKNKNLAKTFTRDETTE